MTRQYHTEINKQFWNSFIWDLLLVSKLTQYSNQVGSVWMRHAIFSILTVCHDTVRERHATLGRHYERYGWVNECFGAGLLSDFRSSVPIANNGMGRWVRRSKLKSRSRSAVTSYVIAKLAGRHSHWKTDLTKSVITLFQLQRCSNVQNDGLKGCSYVAKKVVKHNAKKFAKNKAEKVAKDEAENIAKTCRFPFFQLHFWRLYRRYFLTTFFGDVLATFISTSACFWRLFLVLCELALKSACKPKIPMIK